MVPNWTQLPWDVAGYHQDEPDGSSTAASSTTITWWIMLRAAMDEYAKRRKAGESTKLAELSQVSAETETSNDGDDDTEIYIPSLDEFI